VLQSNVKHARLNRTTPYLLGGAPKILGQSQVTPPMPYLPRHFLDAARAAVVPNTAGSNGRVPDTAAAGCLELAQSENFEEMVARKIREF